MGQSQSTAKFKQAEREYEARLQRNPHVRQAVAECQRELAVKRSTCPRIISTATNYSKFFNDQSPEGRCYFVEGGEEQRNALEKIVSRGWPAVRADWAAGAADMHKEEDCGAGSYSHLSRNQGLVKMGERVSNMRTKIYRRQQRH